MPYNLYGYGGPENDEQRSLLEMLLGGGDIPMPQAPTPPPQHSMGRNVVGSLGDALLSAASVRAGGGPVGVGPYAAGRREADLNYQRRLEQHAERVAEAEQANRVLKRQGIIALMQEQRAAAQQSQFDRRMDETERHNAATEERLEGRRNEIPVYDRYGNAYGYDKDSGRTREILLPDGSRAGRPFSAESIQRAGTLASFRQGINRLKEILPNFIDSRASGIAAGMRLGQQIVRRVPLAGAQISERMDREGEAVAAVRDRAMAEFIRLMSGLQASEAEQGRLLRILPDLGTVDKETALRKIDEFEASVIAYAREIARLQPGLITDPGDLQMLGLAPQATVPQILGISPAASEWLQRNKHEVTP